MEGYRALKILEQFQGDLPTYMPKRSVNNSKTLFTQMRFPTDMV